MGDNQNLHFSCVCRVTPILPVPEWARRAGQSGLMGRSGGICRAQRGEQFGDGVTDPRQLCSVSRSVGRCSAAALGCLLCKEVLTPLGTHRGCRVEQVFLSTPFQRSCSRPSCSPVLGAVSRWFGGSCRRVVLVRSQPSAAQVRLSVPFVLVDTVPPPLQYGGAGRAGAVLRLPPDPLCALGAPGEPCLSPRPVTPGPSASPEPLSGRAAAGTL